MSTAELKSAHDARFFSVPECSSCAMAIDRQGVLNWRPFGLDESSLLALNTMDKNSIEQGPVRESAGDRPRPYG